MPACRRAAHGGQDLHRPGRPLRVRLRHLHATRRPRQARRGAVPQAVPARQDDGPDRRHLAVLLRQLVLEERPGSEQRDQRCGSGPLGHQGPSGRHAGLPACGRKMPRSRRLLCPRRRRGFPQRGGIRAVGADFPNVVESARRFMAQGFRHVRVQIGVPGMAGYGSSRGTAAVKALHSKPVFEPAVYTRRALKLFEVCRKELGDEVELLHDVHERVSPNQAVQFCKDAEKFKLFFMEDPLSPEDLPYFRQIRQQCATPIAMGELFNSPHEWTTLMSERLIDYIRVHVSQAGGFTPARKIAILGEIYGVKTAWHGPGDVSPVGHMANVTLDVTCYNFGIQEYSPFNDRTQEVFQGWPVMKDGYLWVSEKPGWGIEVDEKAASKFAFTAGRNNLNGGWGDSRLRDVTDIKQ